MIYSYRGFFKNPKKAPICLILGPIGFLEIATFYVRNPFDEKNVCRVPIGL
jgi:hypothetical protein